MNLYFDYTRSVLKWDISKHAEGVVHIWSAALRDKRLINNSLTTSFPTCNVYLHDDACWTNDRVVIYESSTHETKDFLQCKSKSSAEEECKACWKLKKHLTQCRLFNTNLGILCSSKESGGTMKSALFVYQNVRNKTLVKKISIRVRIFSLEAG